MLQLEEVAKFIFVATAVISFFTFLTVSHWISTVARERQERERLTLIRKIAEQPAEVAERMREMLREEDAREQQRLHRKSRRARHDGLAGGAVVIAVGTGAAIFLKFIAPGRATWTLAIILILVGLVICVSALTEKPEPAQIDG